MKPEKKNKGEEELQKEIDACNKDIKKVLDKHNFDIEAEVKYSTKGIYAVPVLVKQNEE